jgi:hypothetical protein
VAHALVTSAFVGSGVLYATGGGLVRASAGWRRLAWVRRRRGVRCR